MPYAKVNGVDIYYEIAEAEHRTAMMLPCHHAPMLNSVWN